MTDAYKAHVEMLMAFCKHHTWHGEYTATLRFSEVVADEAGTVGNGTTCLSIKADTVYLRFTITVYPDFESMWEAKDLEQMGRMMLHELCHLFTEPLHLEFEGLLSDVTGRVVKMVNERQVQRISESLHAFFPNGWYTPDYLRSQLEDYASIKTAARIRAIDPAPLGPLP